ncbi:hypothetical protein [Cupriavidus basilensis]|uniref:hypothetical protein n=1 Tax=Cupriavidus basilensis TaxID=68895 RepID=UPI00157AD1B8|nr:hypothetical protein [Cupriavidus basilensis]NUA28528.1 hypothetical protein [Cupriavidus basilensis]
MRQIELLSSMAAGGRLRVSCNPWGEPLQGAFLEAPELPAGALYVYQWQIGRLLRSGLLRRRCASPAASAEFILSASGLAAGTRKSQR